VIFSGGSQLTEIQDFAFADFGRLESISLPPFLNRIGRSCFENCISLRLLDFPLGSSLVRIESRAFAACAQLPVFWVPPSVEYIGADCFCQCCSLEAFGFVGGSQLRELHDLPCQWVWQYQLPDSLEILAFQVPRSRFGNNVLIFGSESRLKEIDIHPRRVVTSYRVFLQFSAPSLKVFRANLEFEI
jgi:hypothetical protein